MSNLLNYYRAVVSLIRKYYLDYYQITFNHDGQIIPVSGGYAYQDYGVNNVNPVMITNQIATFDGVASLQGFELLGETIVSYEGTAIPTIAGDSINITAGVLNSFTLSNGSKYLLKESVGNTITATDDNTIGFVNTSENGILPTNDAETNSDNLQLLVDNNKKIKFDIVGIYSVNQSLQIGDNTTIDFNGSTLKKTSLNGKSPRYVLINKGSFTRTYNYNISILNLKIDSNGIDKGNDVPLIIGLTAHVAFFYVKNLRICNFEMLNILEEWFCIQVCTFENLLINTFNVRGLKDGVHLGRGKFFNINNGRIETRDDSIALNACDYVSCNPEIGNIEYGLIENVEELDTGMFVGSGYTTRFLVGAWLDWFSGMPIKNGDTVISNGRMYRANNYSDGATYTSTTQPTHASGTVTHQGINWLMFQTHVVYEATVKYVDYKNITLNRAKTSAFALVIDEGAYVRSYYPNAASPVITGITFDKIIQKANISYIVLIVAPHDILVIKNSEFNGAKLYTQAVITPGVIYGTFDWRLIGNTYNNSTGPLILDNGRPINLTTYRSIKNNIEWHPVFSPVVNIIQCDIC